MIRTTDHNYIFLLKPDPVDYVTEVVVLIETTCRRKFNKRRYFTCFMKVFGQN